MKIGITGASGFIGRAIVEEAKERGLFVVGFTRSEGRELETCDETRSLADLGNLDLTGLDAILNLAGEPIVGLWTKDKKRRIRESRLDLTEALVETMGQISRSRRPEVLVSASAIGFYGDRGDDWLDEEADVGFDFLSQVCRDWETMASGASRLGVRVVTPRIGLVFGQGGFLKRLRPIFRAGLAGRLGSGNQWMSWIHLRDLARVFVDCATNSSIRGRVNAVAPNPATNREFTSAYATSLGRKAIFPVPSFALRRIPGGMSSLFLASQRVDPVVMKAFDFQWEHADLGETLALIESDR
ncbi:MAG: TIGR01777 family oxidoreductase [Verrucomicrobiota bacterium]